MDNTRIRHLPKQPRQPNTAPYPNHFRNNGIQITINQQLIRSSRIFPSMGYQLLNVPACCTVAQGSHSTTPLSEQTEEDEGPSKITCNVHCQCPNQAEANGGDPASTLKPRRGTYRGRDSRTPKQTLVTSSGTRLPSVKTSGPCGSSQQD